MKQAKHSLSIRSVQVIVTRLYGGTALPKVDQKDFRVGKFVGGITQPFLRDIYYVKATLTMIMTASRRARMPQFLANGARG